MTRSHPLLMTFALPMLATLAACGDGGSGATGTSSSATTTQAAAQFDVTPCMNQMVGGKTLSSLVVPDVVTLDPSKASGFPNGRTLSDPVIDLELARLFLDLSTQAPDVLAKRPLDPSGNDVPLYSTFPFLGNAQGGVPASAGGSGFSFRTDAATAYTRVDRMGEPAVATALVRTAMKTAFNDDSPVDDATGKWTPQFVLGLTDLTDELYDDLTAAGFKLCAKQI